MFLLDTNVVSELRRRDKTDPRVSAWSDAIPPDDLFLAAVTVLELEAGVLTMERRDTAQGAVLRRWLDNKVLPSFSGRILPVDTAIALRCARLHVPNPKPERDAMIAATALVKHLTVVTRNVSDFQQMGVDLLNPWNAS
jgi:hypothetical protein